jgi:hypothetical protein
VNGAKVIHKTCWNKATQDMGHLQQSLIVTV